MIDSDVLGACCAHEYGDHKKNGKACTREEYIDEKNSAFRRRCTCKRFRLLREDNPQMDLSQAARW